MIDNRVPYHTRCLRAFPLALALIGCTILQAADKPKKLDPVDELAGVLEPDRKIVYKTVDGRELHLHLFHPPGYRTTDQRPCFLAIHGGGWTGGEPRRFYPFAAHFARLGMLGVSLEYRLAKPAAGTTPIVCVKDGRSAVRYLRTQARALGIDPKKIVAMGGSAGGHIAAGTALFDGIDEHGEDISISSMPNGLVLWFPVIDTSPEGYGNAKCGAQWKEISPLHHVKPGLPPTLVLHGTGDTVTPFQGAKRFHEEMLKAENRCELVVHEGGRHGYLMFDKALLEEALQRTEVFLASLGMIGSNRSGLADDWPQYRGPQSDGVWRETGIVQTLPKEVVYRWKTPIGGGFAGPAVAKGKVYVCDRVLPKGTTNPESRWDRRDPVSGSERVLCLDAASGSILWSHEYPCRYEISYPAGPRATPTVHGGKVYTVGAMGDLFCLDAQTGKVLWSKNYVRDFDATINPWGMAAAPLIDGDRLILITGGKDGACVVALHKDTGAEIWRALESVDPGYSTPVIVEAGGVRQLLVWLPIGLYGLDPATGKVHWSQPAEVRMGHSIASPIYDPERRLVFATSFFNGPIMMQADAHAPKASLLWKGQSNSELPRNTEGLHCLMSTPVFDKGYLYGVCSYGHLRCLDAMTGKRIWETLAPIGENRWATAFLIPHADRCFLFCETGDLILAKLSPAGYDEISRTRLIEPTQQAGRRKVVWSYPAFANRCIFVRNDTQIVCVDLPVK